MTDQTEYYRWRKSVSSSYYEDEPTGLEVWLEGRKPLLAEIETLRERVREANQGAERNAIINRELARELAALKAGPA